MGFSDYFGIVPGGALYFGSDREAAIKGKLGSGPYIFTGITPSGYVPGGGFAPVDVLESFGRMPWFGDLAVSNNYFNILSSSQELGVEADLLSAIIERENATGWKDYLNIFGNTSILPGNIQPHWADILPDVSRDQLKNDAKENIRVVAALLARIENMLPVGERTPARIASLYNALRADGINQYGKNVDALYQTQSNPTALQNYRPIQLSTRYRTSVAGYYNAVYGVDASEGAALARKNGIPGYSDNTSKLLIDYREAYKLNKDLTSYAAALEKAGVPIPDPYSEVWSFCFSGDTEVLMADGSRRPIADVSIGDEVMAFSEFSDMGRGMLVPRRVTRLFKKITDEWLKLFNGVTVTPRHFFLTTDGDYELISQIPEKRNGEVVLEDGSVERLTAERIIFSKRRRTFMSAQLDM